MSNPNDFSAAPADHLPEDEDRTLWVNAPVEHVRPLRTGGDAWVFAGARAMPLTEHLIPFQN